MGGRAARVDRARHRAAAQTEDGEFQLHPDPVRGEQGQPETYGVCAYSLLELLAMVDEFHDEPMIEPGRLEAIRAKLHA